MRFQQKNTGDDVQAVGDPVLNFLQQHFLLAQQLLVWRRRFASPRPTSRRSKIFANLEGHTKPMTPLVISTATAFSISIRTSAVERQRS